MSRIGKAPIPLPQGVSVEIGDDEVRVKGPKGTLSRARLSGVAVKVDGGLIQVSATEDSRQTRAYYGLFRTLVNNMVVGVSEGFERRLEVVGVGYRAGVQGKSLNLSLGYSQPVSFTLPEGIEAAVNKQFITLTGIDKEVVGQTAAKIRALRPPEPYKGKGIKYVEEHIRRKVGKAGIKVGA